MKKSIIILASLVLITIIAVIACNSKTNNKLPATTGTSDLSETEKQDPVERGKYLVSIMGCDDCHTPKKMGEHGPEPDMAKRFSGHPANIPLGKINKDALKDWVLFNQGLTAFVGPWGVSFAANLTSDDTGIGTWSEEQFITSIREGKYKGLKNSRDLLPPMPWPVYKNATDEDLKAIYAYLKSTPAVVNIVPPSITPDRLPEN